MTIDWFVWLTPLIFLPIVALFAFVGCQFDASGLAGSWYPGLMVKAENLHSTAWFWAIWTFYNSNSNVPLGVIKRPVPGVMFPGQKQHGQDVPPGNPYQPDASIELDSTDAEFAKILLLNPDQVQCECSVQDADQNKPEEEVRVTPGPDYLSFKPGGPPTMVWVLTRTDPPLEKYMLEPYA